MNTTQIATLIVLAVVFVVGFVLAGPIWALIKLVCFLVGAITIAKWVLEAASE